MKLFKKYYTVFCFTIFLLSFTQLFAQHKNIKISGESDPEEVTICIDPLNPAILVAGANTEHYYYSGDTGRTWKDGSMRSSFGVWGDLCMLVDSLGDFYCFHLSKMESGNSYDRLICQKSYDKGATWSDGTYLGTNSDFSQDKEWAAIDPVTNYIYVTWTEQKESYSRPVYGTKTKTNIMLSISKDLGHTWTKSMRINETPGADFDDWKSVIGAMPAIGSNHEVYATWVNYDAIMFDKSLDSGKTWLENDVLIDSLDYRWSMKVSGMYRCYTFPIIACDASKGTYNGNIYICWADQDEENTDTDIFLSKSSDNGVTWSSPAKVNNDTTEHHQYMPWITVDQVTGKVYVLFYDRRHHANSKTDVYMATSSDGGETFINTKINKSSFTPNSGTFMGDYIGIAANNDIVRPIWTIMDDHQNMSIWTAIIDVTKLK
jgi:hypothetical protein